MAGLVFDTAPLIALERGDRRAQAWFAEAVDAGVVPVVPAVVLAESWRGGPRSALLARALAGCRVRITDEDLAREAGLLLGRVGCDATVDAIVVATAAAEGADVLTADRADIGPLAVQAGVRVMDL